MRSGAWHQFCFNSQNLIEEQLVNGIGVGAILSPKDINETSLKTIANRYKAAGASVLIDQQFYVPEFSNKNLKTYGVSAYRPNVSRLTNFSETSLDALTRELYELSKAASVDAVISPALAYEAGRPEISVFNARLFKAAKRAGDALGVPTYATVIVANSATASDATIDSVISQATALIADGYYYGFEFDQVPRIPNDKDKVLRALSAGLTLACTGQPVLNAFAGPMGLLSFGYGAKGAAIGHFQTVWKFNRAHWGKKEEQGGGGTAPPRFFSTALWGTIVYPDEIRSLSTDNKKNVVTTTRHSAPVGKTGEVVWPKWDSNKHFLEAVGQEYDRLGQIGSARKACDSILSTLESAALFHKDIRRQGIKLKDGSDSYQVPWHSALKSLLASRSHDFEYLELLN